MAALGDDGGGHGDLLEDGEAAPQPGHRTQSMTDCSQSTIGPVARFPIGMPDPVISCRSRVSCQRRPLLRCLKRTIARELYPLIIEALTAPEPT